MNSVPGVDVEVPENDILAASDKHRFAPDVRGLGDPVEGERDSVLKPNTIPL
jgi:hypothetical protein